MKKYKLFTVFTVIMLILVSLFWVVSAAPAVPTPTPTPPPTTSQDSGFMSAINNMISGLGDLGKGILDIPKNFFDMFVNGATTGAVATLVAFMTGFMDIVTNMMSKGDAVFNSSVVSGLALILRPFAYNIMVLLFMAGITKKAAYMEAMSPAVFFESLGLMLLSKFLIDNSVKLLSLISEIFTSITNRVLHYPQKTIDELWDMEKLVSTLQKTTNGDVFKLMGVNIIVFASLFILALCMIVIFVVLVSRQIELGVLAVSSPLAMSTIASSISNDVFKAFLKYFIGVVAQTLFMAIAIVIFTASVFDYIKGTGTGIFAGFLEMLIGLVGLSIYIVRMPNSIKHILGMGGGGSGLSIASFAALLL